jgi:hypothetical protein
MSHTFDEEDKDDLLDRGFNEEQIQFLESLEMNTKNMYFDICKLMDDYNDSPSKIIVDYKEANGIPITGGKRKTRRNKQIRRTKNSKRNKSRRNKRSKRSKRR